MPRIELINSFLADTVCANFEISYLAGDASPRKYVRLTKSGYPSYVVMDAPPETGERILPFIEIAKLLTSGGLAAPNLIKIDQSNGLILMQDFGDTSFFNCVAETPRLEKPLYKAAINVLHHLHTLDANGLTHYGPLEMANAARLAADWYADTMDDHALFNAISEQLEKLDWSQPVIVLRDYHAQNLIWRTNEIGFAQVGLLDFQDAQIGHPLYDAASLMFDARRDVSQATIKYLCEFLRPDYENFDRDLSIVSAQRNLRILGVFARLCIRDGKFGYVDLIPRVWKNLQRDLEHPDLVSLRNCVADLPKPSANFLNNLRSKCATTP